MATADATRRAVLGSVLAGAAALAGCSGGDGDGGSGSPTATMTDDFAFETPAFEDGGTVPRKYTCDGEDVSPALSVSDLPPRAETIAVVVDDPDAPGSGAFTHWLVWNVPADVGTIPEGVPTTETVPELGGARQGATDFSNGPVGYHGPCPPGSHDAHTYRFTAYAVSGQLSTPAGADESTLLSALDGSTVGTSRFTGERERG